MTAYYNENDSFAAAWLRELIKANLIAPGEVDERSIEEIKPNDLRGFTQCHFFAGIGVWSYALRNAGWADASPVWSGSCPCQGFSASGKRGGFSDKRHLWPTWFRLIRECRPHTVFGEQVSSPDGLAWLDVVSADLENEKYAIGTLDISAASVGAPHIRQRLYFVADSGSERRDGQRLRLQSGQPRQASIEVGRRGETSSMVNASEPRREGNMAAPLQRGRDSGPGTANELGNPSEQGPQRHGRLEQERYSQGRETAERYDPSSGSNGELADANIVESSNGELQRGGRLGRIEKDEASSVMAHTRDTERRASSVGRDDDHATETGWNKSTSSNRECGEVDELANTKRDGAQRAGSEELIVDARRPTNGFWRDAEWLYCRDGKYRPTKSGSPVLATGITNRVGLLRGFGNSIVAPVAEAFIRSYMSLDRTT